MLEAAVTENPAADGIILGSHGLFTWGATAYESYINTLEVIERCAAYLEENYGKKGPVFGGQKIQSLDEAARKKQAAAIAPILRGFCSSQKLPSESVNERSFECKMLGSGPHILQIWHSLSACFDGSFKTQTTTVISPNAVGRETVG